MVSILDILSGALPLMVDVRQTGGSPNADVVFDARPGSTHWKDVMVMLVGVIRDSDLEVKFVGFYDLVAARMHPASTMIDQS
jgi:hypothetical protein